jgi:hypothetical protein
LANAFRWNDIRSFGHEELSTKQPFVRQPIDFSFPETRRKLDCDGDILEL